MLDIGEKLQEGHYRIVDILGQGGTATVYLAADTRLGDRRVAIKEMDPAAISPDDPDWAVTAFRQEAEVLARLSHRSIARVTDFFEERGYWYLVMEYVPGETLEAAIHRVNRFSEEQVLAWAGQLADMLAYLHGQDPPIIFRDLKPSNVMVQVDGKLKLIDFGIARIFKPEKQEDTVKLGTRGYAAPEQYGQSQTDPRSDVYSLGVLLHQLLTGYDPTTSPMHLPPVQQLRPDVSASVAAAIDQALQMDPDARFNTVLAFAAALGAPLPGPATPQDQIGSNGAALVGIGLWLREHKTAAFASAAILALALAALVYFLIYQGDTGGSNNDAEETEQAIAETTAVVQTEIVAANSTATTAVQQSATAKAIAAAATTSAPTETSTPTPSPTATATATSTPTPTPTDTPSPTLTPTTPAPTRCSINVHGSFDSDYRRWADRLGCPLNQGRRVNIVQEVFDHGRMFWREDNDMIYVVYNTGAWAQYLDAWRESQPEFSCGTPESPPTPKRGFGKTWCTHGSVRNGLGDAINHEWSESVLVQDFADGTLLDHGGQLYLFFADNNTWRTNSTA
ncbi:MAG: serine/threonine protein kinase [Chloroflexota bacterium]|nr:MAG: serine/threonine protein kinase [Chloroflexota bacterium]